MFPKGSLLLKAKHLVEAAVVIPLYLLFRLLPFAVSSLLVGKLVRFVGRFFEKANTTAKRNIEFCFSEKTAKEREKILLDSWENLGRTAGELPHISSDPNSKMQERCPISGIENVDESANFAKKNDVGLILVSAHIGNWEVASRMLLVLDESTALIYRKANNPYVEKLIQKMRGNYTSFIIPKGDKSGVRDIVKHLKSGGRLGMLADQKLNSGIEVNFFNKIVKAPGAAAEFAIKYNMPIVMGRVVRDEKTKLNFVLKFEAPIYPEGKTEQEITQQIYNTYETWIKQYPGQWLWQHNRFDLY